MRFFLFSLVLLLAAAPAARCQENLSADAPFFEKAAQKYQKWLDGCGLGPALRLRSAEVKNDTVLVVFLGFSVSDADSAKAVWVRLRADFAEKTGGEALETALFDKIGWYFEVPQSQARLYLTDNNRGPKSLCWEARMVPGRDGSPVFQEKNYECGFKSQDFPVSIGPQDLGGLRAPTAAKILAEMDKPTVFQKLKPWLTARFQKPQPDGGWSHIHFSDEWASLKFEATDLRREVIADDHSSWLCEVLCGCPTCQPHERLEVTLKYAELRNAAGKIEGFELSANLAAQYGSGIWKPREGGWHDLDDETAKKSLLKKYGERLAHDLKAHLLRP